MPGCVSSLVYFRRSSETSKLLTRKNRVVKRILSLSLSLSLSQPQRGGLRARASCRTRCEKVSRGEEIREKSRHRLWKTATRSWDVESRTDGKNHRRGGRRSVDEGGEGIEEKEEVVEEEKEERG